jgi:hypothetical protein
MGRTARNGVLTSPDGKLRPQVNELQRHERMALVLAQTAGTRVRRARALVVGARQMGGSGCRSEAVHQDVQQAACPGVVFGRAGHGEDADEAGSDVFGGDVGA